jgi:Na+-driven multidrug efflux pump
LNGACFSYSALLVSLGKTRVLVPATIVLGATNVVLNYIFVFGKLGAPALGMRGAAIASVGAEAATFVFLTIYMWRYLDPRYHLLRIRRFHSRTTRVLSRICSPIAAHLTYLAAIHLTWPLALVWGPCLLHASSA